MRIIDEAQQIDALIKKFCECVKLSFAAWEVGDMQRQRAAMRKAHKAVEALDAFGTGHRAALAKLLDTDDAEIRVVAAGQLIDIMPELALQHLRQIDKDVFYGPVGIMAMHAIFMHEHPQQPHPTRHP